MTTVLWRFISIRLLKHPSIDALQAYCDEELRPSLRRRLHRHLGECPSCAAEVASRLSLYETIEEPEPNAAEVAELHGRLFDAIGSSATAVVGSDVKALLGKSAIPETGRPGRLVTPALERQLATFLGRRAASRLQAGWTARIDCRH